MSLHRIDEEKNLTQEELTTVPASDDDDDDDDDESSSEDEDAHLKRLRPPSSSTAGGGDNSRFSIRRNDSLNSFLTRSERAAMLGKDKPPSSEEARKRTVKFRDEAELENVHEIEQVADEDRAKVYMNNEDFSRIETDLKMTSFRWENHLDGKISFDENNNSMRGLEHLQDRDKQTKRDLQKYKHNRSVLEEINRQKQDYGGKVRDWDAVRRISQQFSVHSINHAVELARLDREAHRRAWNNGEAAAPSSAQSSLSSSQQADKDGKKKKKGKFLFWQKK